ncbi:peptidase M23-like protein [Aquabacterium commune]|uniref:Peptidase M23-like protein n=1 Tax=Aquabacterium commune TaxID=70586 RepID=A0A4R6RP05_9BURK|nr:M23 family metallopeptidase [Aquabacterium commune]TDP88479.1 peptidase M23-like protein [Aquabacterium commune]
MQILITTSVLSRPRVVQFTPWRLALALLALTLPLMVVSLLLYHALLLKAAHEHWPIISEAVRFVERQELAQRDRYMRENLDAMAVKVGEMQARMMRLEAVSERVAGMAGLKPDELKKIEAETGAAAGGPLVSLAEANRDERRTSNQLLQDLNTQMDSLQGLGDRHGDVLTLIESHLFEKRLDALMVPSIAPVDGPVGSGFGFRADPFTHRAALHTGLDFPAEPGTPILAAAGGVVLSAEPHPQYGLLVELDHGNGLVTRYAHTSKMLVKPGDLVKRGQAIAAVGNTGRSTGPHLHFEVLVEGVQQNPARFLNAALAAPAAPTSQKSNARGVN